MASTPQEPQSLSDLIGQVPSIVDHLFRNPPKNALTIFTQMMPGDAVRPEFTTWRDEQRAWRETIALHDQSFHMDSLHLRGPGALDLCQYLAVNSFRNFEVGAAKQLLACSPEGYVIGDAILYRLEEEHFIVVGNPATTDWVRFNAETLGYDVAAELDPMWALNKAKRRNFYRYQVEGPNAWQLLEKLHGGPLPEIKFFRSDIINIAGCRVRGMRHTMGGVPGLELSGPWEDRKTVKNALVSAGQEFGLRQIGSIAYFTTVIESGWWAVPVSAVYTSPELKAYRDWLTARNAAMRMSLGGSFYSPNIEDYYLTPYDLNYGHLVKFDHDYIGRAALERMKEKPHRKKVTLVWNAEDVLKVMESQFEAGSGNPLPITMPLAACARMHYDRVTDKTGRTIGLATYPTYTVNERAVMSLCSIDQDFAEYGTEVILHWGEDGGGSRSAGNIEPHEQVKIRAIVAPCPISQAAQSYRSEIGVRRGSREEI
ncbi:aminomethyl transferase family protein [Chelativorans sp. SCAU2101]|jgi:Glycine cleavage system T protein (aminomethyltransferase)|uniref:Aminomethyl transferase family protein n=1 Tax=Chelativorans petroleitrophicus TaxID=2975484 RepID=A0A9X2X886_9HYPH|nr:aminomethyl transferase family protein [Chelativorans petroleitrophicus]